MRKTNDDRATTGNVRNEPARANIDLARISADSNAGGLIFTIATILIFLVGIPALRSVAPVLLAAGCLVAAVIRFVHR